MPHHRSTRHATRDGGGGGGGLVKQGYLLTLGDYTETASNGTLCREFQVGKLAECHGLRYKSNAVGTQNIRLYRLSDQALLASKDGVATVIGENELLFDSAVTLGAGVDYRIGVYGGTRYALNANDHPDGENVTLTSNCYNYNAADACPTGNVNNWSVCIEPIIYA